MISKIRYPDGRNYVCDGCGGNIEKFKSIKEAKVAGWAISRGYTNCYCPDCAPMHRNVGRRGHFSSGKI